MRCGRRLCLVVFGALLSGACLSPTLPLPPPAKPTISTPDSRGFALVVGKVPANTTIYVENLRNGKVAGERTPSTGRYSVEIEAEVADRLQIYYVQSLERSQSIVVLVPAATGEGGAGGGGP